MMGSNGPKISAFIIRESSGASNRTVGEILLQKINSGESS
jgi:hypothetical protein